MMLMFLPRSLLSFSRVFCSFENCTADWWSFAAISPCVASTSVKTKPKVSTSLSTRFAVVLRDPWHSHPSCRTHTPAKIAADTAEGPVLHPVRANHVPTVHHTSSLPLSARTGNCKRQGSWCSASPGVLGLGSIRNRMKYNVSSCAIMDHHMYRSQHILCTSYSYYYSSNTYIDTLITSVRTLLVSIQRHTCTFNIKQTYTPVTLLTKNYAACMHMLYTPANMPWVTCIHDRLLSHLQHIAWSALV